MCLLKWTRSCFLLSIRLLTHPLPTPQLPLRTQVCGVHDFSMKDLLAPEPKRVRRHLSAVINFAKFREERLVMYAELAVKVRT